MVATGGMAGTGAGRAPVTAGTVPHRNPFRTPLTPGRPNQLRQNPGPPQVVVTAIEHPLKGWVDTDTDMSPMPESEVRMQAISPDKHDLARALPRTGLILGLALWAGFTGQVLAQEAGQSPGSYQVVGAMAAYLGVMPAEIVGGHQRGHPESQMHGGPPDSPHAEHVVVALFEEPSGIRIENATVTATIAGMGDIAITPIALDPMPIAGVVTYGGYMTFPGRDTYTIEVMVTLPDSPTVTQISFVYDHSGL